MKHTVIVSSYNRPTMICDCLDSIKNQTFGDFEVIIMDDGSEQQTINAIKEYLKDDRFRYIDFSDKKVDNVWRYTVGINNAIPKITGQIVHYLPDDDIFEPHRFENIEKFKKKYMVGYGALVYFKNRNTKGLFNDILNMENKRFPTRDISPDNEHPSSGLIDHSQIFHRIECFEKVPKWKLVNGCSDCIFFNELSKHYKFYGMPIVIGAKRSHEKCLMKLKNHKREIKE